MLEIVWLYDLKDLGKKHKSKKYLGLVKGDIVLFKIEIMRKKLRILGMCLGIISMILATILYGWELALIIILALTGNNLEKTFRE